MEITAEDVEMLVVPKPPKRSRRDEATTELRPSDLEEMIVSDDDEVDEEDGDFEFPHAVEAMDLSDATGEFDADKAASVDVPEDDAEEGADEEREPAE